MNEIYFLVRYTPFWSIPLLLIGAEFSYLFWMRKKVKMVAFCSVFSVWGLVATVAYYVAGGPEKSVKLIMGIVHYFS
ncbi:MAG: hypothetical protein HON90_14785 [Halobacteriovoraceae bacterium]|jgi:hypothetical protein|nr:hypothetical protein [Halobacteriovoraceae bacterium]